MTYLFEALKKPTRLYIKQCPHCNLKYFGKSIEENIEKYPGSGTVWKRHLKKHHVDPLHLWHSTWYHDTSIKRFATKFSVMNNIVASNKWANLAIENGIDGGNLGDAAINRMRSTKNDPLWKQTVGKDAADKQTITRNSIDWKSTVGKSATERRLETINNLEWKQTIGTATNKKISQTKNDPIWIETVGKDAARKRLDKIDYAEIAAKVSRTQSDPEWIETVGKQARQKRHNTVSSEEWKASVGQQRAEKYSATVLDPLWLETKGRERSEKQSERARNRQKLTCNHCGKQASGSNYTRWHGNNCKHRP